MKHNETHAVHDALAGLFNDLVGDKRWPMWPHQIITSVFFQRFVGQAVFGCFICAVRTCFVAQFANDVCNGFRADRSDAA